MKGYLEKFGTELLRRWAGSLVKVASISHEHKNAKEYLNKLSKEGTIERVTWGWYYVPGKVPMKFEGVFDFLRHDKNFKVLVAQTAASFWNGDFIHRNVYSMVVKDGSCKKALLEFAKKKGWNFKVTVNENAEREINFAKTEGLNVEKPAEAVISCIHNWAFTDAFSILLSNSRIRAKLSKFYWKRVSGTDTRIGQVISYGLNERRTARISERLKGEIDESIEKVKELA